MLYVGVASPQLFLRLALLSFHGEFGAEKKVSSGQEVVLSFAGLTVQNERQEFIQEIDTL